MSPPSARYTPRACGAATVLTASPPGALVIGATWSLYSDAAGCVQVSCSVPGFSVRLPQRPVAGIARLVCGRDVGGA